ncbi:hypothetical protein MHY87_11105 [Microvirga sp. ACRRW]|uniref:hypothetical protein n=1 Tax=Microvirga sp. ACRRW TaxID=2918205 RepID=UPI001EF404C9|nr:hypothetical protein [Microvirga sp. ACRRW]MCG7393454.1 hypothetical protein [Microvirga sp. ACRRW]
MGSSIVLIWIGALLILCGVVYGAALALWGGRLSDARRDRPMRAGDSLEPRQSPKSFSIRTHWPALAMILLGSILIFTETAF